MLMLAKAGKVKGCLIEGMGCPGGCVAGVGTVIAPEKAKVFVDMSVKNSDKAIPPKELEETADRLTNMK
jgi:iron only hydrogenase large subunit-like protein